MAQQRIPGGKVKGNCRQLSTVVQQTGPETYRNSGGKCPKQITFLSDSQKSETTYETLWTRWRCWWQTALMPGTRLGVMEYGGEFWWWSMLLVTNAMCWWWILVIMNLVVVNTSDDRCWWECSWLWILWWWILVMADGGDNTGDYEFCGGEYK